MAEQVVEGIRASGGRAKAIAVNLASVEGPRELASHTRSIIGDRLDILVINTRLPKAVDSSLATLEGFDSEFAANVRAPLFLVQQLLPVMHHGSCLVFSLAPPATPVDDPASSAIRGGLDGLVSRLAVLLKSRGVRVDAVIPASAMAAEGFHATKAMLPETQRRPLAKGNERSVDIARTVVAIITSTR
jgi:NAD(P)-dependent dehydrogenase (short-subunit alcohol dehydrogenase family)